MVAGFAAGRSLVHAGELPQADPVLLRALYDATAGTATDTTRCQGRSPRIKRPISDGVVGIVDVLTVLAQWGQVGSSCDFDGGGVGINDFLDLLAHKGPCPR
jgi:hypothetical protein